MQQRADNSTQHAAMHPTLQMNVSRVACEDCSKDLGLDWLRKRAKGSGFLIYYDIPVAYMMEKGALGALRLLRLTRSLKLRHACPSPCEVDSLRAPLISNGARASPLPHTRRQAGVPGALR